MRLFILCNQVKADSYADALFRWLLQLLSEKSFTVTECYEIKEVTELNFNTERTAIILYSMRKKLSFFSKLALQQAIKKQAFTCCVQVTDTKPFSSKLLQLIFSNDTGSFINNKPSSSVFYAVFSTTEKQKLTELNDATANQIKMIPVTAEDDFQPITWSEQQAVKMQYTQGREYFFTFAEGKTAQIFTDLLKAFSTFKKWQHSSMKLVILGALSFTENDEWKEKTGTYKFREDIVWLTNVSHQEMVRTLAGAYAFIHMPDRNNDVLPLLQAMKCETACLSFTTDGIKEYADDAVVQIEPSNYDQLAEKMILLYKDEALRSRLIANGKEVLQNYTKEKTFTALAEVLSLPLH